MSNIQERERKEMMNLFKDPRFSRKAWQAVGLALLQRPAIVTPALYDKEGNETRDSLIERYSYDKLAHDIDALGGGYKPTELEMILQCQMIHARHNPASAQFIRDTLGAKPIDESKSDVTVHNQYETLSDEELELLAARRKAQPSQSGEPSASSLPHVVDTEDISI